MSGPETDPKLLGMIGDPKIAGMDGSGGFTNAKPGSAQTRNGVTSGAGGLASLADAERARAEYVEKWKAAQAAESGSPMGRKGLGGTSPTTSSFRQPPPAPAPHKMTPDELLAYAKKMLEHQETSNNASLAAGPSVHSDPAGDQHYARDLYAPGPNDQIQYDSEFGPSKWDHEPYRPGSKSGMSDEQEDENDFTTRDDEKGDA